ncbi:DUF1254 domain-containing protein [Lacihabitans sp. CCS-44]|uniref:DUF1214 domain-containing protein n=1 Tax=Lacihabitans sp. CCS-44 TaxID=2487331 RepID=UPI0020CD8093|nr:DUF1214 domain-containing protein [Lacihabitans sp. CCS-44]MCP9757629.1 DUF1254 domain-containing protein [Lacihabitans sp. CCS-44]
MTKTSSLFLILITIYVSGYAQITNKNELEAYKSAYNAYVWGFPLVTLSLTIDEFVQNPERAKFNNFAIISSNIKQKTISNEDIIYSKAFLDLKESPLLITLPLNNLKYYSLTFTDAYSSIFEVFGSIKNISKEKAILIVGPDWKGEIPKGIKKIIKSPTNLAWVEGKVSVLDKLEMIESKKLLESIKITEIDKNESKKTWTERHTFPKLKTTGNPAELALAMDWKSYFAFMSQILKENQLQEYQKKYVLDFEDLGIFVGKDFEDAKVSNKKQKGIKQGFADATELLKTEAPRQEDYNKNGWSYNVGEGKWGNKYTKSAASAFNGFNQTASEETMKYKTSIDINKEKLEGNKKYKLTLKKTQLPQTKAFWTLNVLQSDKQVFENPKGKYGIGNKSKGLKYNKDGSLTIYLQAEPPKGFETNWVPTPSQNFELVLKVFAPGELVYSGEWAPPAIEIVK